MQELNFRPDLNQIAFGCNGVPVYGMGPGGPSDEQARRDGHHAATKQVTTCASSERATRFRG